MNIRRARDGKQVFYGSLYTENLKRVVLTHIGVSACPEIDPHMRVSATRIKRAVVTHSPMCCVS